MSVYVNRLLNLKKIKVVGFDMDYTLAAYDVDAFEQLVHSLSVKRLMRDYNYPSAISGLQFENNRAIVGLVIDKRNGNLLKLNRFGQVKTASHGLEMLDFREHEALYKEQFIDLKGQDFQSLDTAFAISRAVLFSQLVQMKKDGSKLPDFRQIDADVNLCTDTLHTDGTIKTILRKNFDTYVIPDPETAKMLELLKIYGKKLMVITNSEYGYSSDLLDYCLNPYWENHRSWRDVFDLVITLADKPRFFEGFNRFLRIDPETGAMSNHLGSVSSGFFQGGWFEDVQKGFGVEGHDILYIGDHIYGDVVSIKRHCSWRTGLVLSGLSKEIETNYSTRELQAEIDRLMNRKSWLEKEADEAEMKRRLGKKVSVSQEHIAEQNRLNTQISALLEKLKTYYNPFWGEILRSGSEESRYADQVEGYACIYMTRVSDLGKYSPRTYFRPRRRALAHEALDLP